MRTNNGRLVALAIGLLIGSSVMAQGIAKADHKLAMQRISAEYKAAKAACASLSGNAKDICVEEAKGKEKIAKAELQANYKPSSHARYKVQLASAHAGYAVAKQRCDDLSGNVKDVCVKEAKAAQTAATADAEVQLKTALANANSNAAAKQAETTKADVRNDAAAQKRDAQYKVEKEKCDAFASNAKDNCLTQAKVRFAK
jgi:hypothetical protein